MSDHGEYKARQRPPLKVGDAAVIRQWFACPFCGLDAYIVEPEGVGHAVPPCPTFLDLEPTDYLAAVNHANKTRN